MGRRKHHRNLTASELNQNPRGALSSIPDISCPEFGYSSGHPSGSPSGKPTIDTYPVTITKTSIVPIETLTKDNYHMKKYFPSDKSSNMLMEYPSGYPIGATSTIQNYKSRPKPREEPISDPDIIKRQIQESQVSTKRNIILFIPHIILSSS